MSVLWMLGHYFFSQIHREAVPIFAVNYKVHVILTGHLIVLLKHRFDKF